MHAHPLNTFALIEENHLNAQSFQLPNALSEKETTNLYQSLLDISQQYLKISSGPYQIT